MDGEEGGAANSITFETRVALRRLQGEETKDGPHYPCAALLTSL